MDYFLILNDHPPIIIHEEDRRVYYNALECWDDDQVLDPLISFLKKQTVKSWEKQLLKHGVDSFGEKGFFDEDFVKLDKTYRW